MFDNTNKLECYDSVNRSKTFSPAIVACVIFSSARFVAHIHICICTTNCVKLVNSHTKFHIIYTVKSTVKLTTLINSFKNLNLKNKKIKHKNLKLKKLKHKNLKLKHPYLLTNLKFSDRIILALEKCRNLIVYRGIAQLVEQRSPKPRAEGSSPSAPAKLKRLKHCV